MKTCLQAVLEKGQIVAPGVMDNISVRAVELSGFSAAVLTASGLSYSGNGFPSYGLLNAEELIWMTNRMTDYALIPVIVDADGGYGTTPAQVYVTIMRLAKNGAAAIIIDDSTEVRGSDREYGEAVPEVIAEELFLSKIRAATEACENTDCLVIARTLSLTALGLEAAAKRCAAARRAGARITMVDGVWSHEQAQVVNNVDPGWKMWPDVRVIDGVPAVSYEELDSLGYRIIFMDYVANAAMYGMLLYGQRTLTDGNLVFHDTHDYDGMIKPGENYHMFLAYWKKWLPMEDEYYDLSDLNKLDFSHITIQ